MYRVRPAFSSEHGEIVEIAKQFPHAYHYQWKQYASERVYKYEHTIVATNSENKIVGFCYINDTGKNSIHVKYLCILPEGKGAGAELVNWIHERHKDKDAFWCKINHDDTDTIEFMERMGYKYERSLTEYKPEMVLLIRRIE